MKVSWEVDSGRNFDLVAVACNGLDEVGLVAKFFAQALDYYIDDVASDVVFVAPHVMN